MAQYPTYEEGYRIGVNKATEDFTYEEVHDLPITEGFNGGVLRTFLANRRKALLTKKVTKWVVVLKAGKFSEESVSQGRLFDTREGAERYVKAQVGDSCLGVFPIEIEVPF